MFKKITKLKNQIKPMALSVQIVEILNQVTSVVNVELN